LIVSPLPAEPPAGSDELAAACAARLPRVQLLALLIEVDQMTRFSEEFTHAGGAQPRNPELRRNLYAALITYACNLGYAGMADASGISEDQLAWTSQWYLRQETRDPRLAHQPLRGAPGRRVPPAAGMLSLG
jgi:hypothetical protein